MSQVDQAQQNHTSADSQKRKTALIMRLGETQCQQINPLPKNMFEGLISILQSSNCEHLWSNKVDHLKMDPG